MLNDTRNDSGSVSLVPITIIGTFYAVGFLTSELGNGFVVVSLLVRRSSANRKTIDDFVLSLAATDFLFATLTLFDAAQYLLEEWKLGAVVCKIQGQLLEMTYTVSTLTLATISYSRYKAANTADPFALIRVKPNVKRNIALVWLASFAFSLPLFHAYTVVSKDGVQFCTNKNFDELTRQMYYLVQAVLLFFVPVTIMIVTQRKITSGLRSYSEAVTPTLQAVTPKLQAMTPELEATLQATTLVLQATTQPVSTRAAMFERRITKLLTRVWLIFSCCWTPFIMYRTLDYFMHIRERSKAWYVLWQVCQCLLLLNTAINPFLYYRITMKGFGGRAKARCIAVWSCCIHR